MVASDLKTVLKKENAGSIGQLVANCEARIVDPVTGMDVDVGKDGVCQFSLKQESSFFLSCSSPWLIMWNNKRLGTLGSWPERHEGLPQQPACDGRYKG